MKVPLEKEEIFTFIGALTLLGIHSVRKHLQAWSTKSAQVLVRFSELISCKRYELIGTFLHIVTTEEAALAGNRLSKVLPLHVHIKNKCLELYQPQQQLSVDERMVKSIARSRF